MGTPYRPAPPSSGKVVTAKPTFTQIDMRTLARKTNESAAKQPSYEFGGGRVRKYQPRDHEND